ncbi:MAG: PilZ domain-containing protein [Deltaproteobacteria bacterium]|nr:PilZ domain-containing protein [Deltaproteobacteria bacterium]
MKEKILLVGNLSSVAQSLAEEVLAAGFVAVSATTSDEALSVLAGEQVFGIVYEAGSPAVERVCATVRGNARYDAVPLIAFVTDVSEKVLGPVFAAGTDDYLPLGERGDLEDKLRELRESAAAGVATYTKARAVVADAERQRRVLYARTLRQASYDVHFALDEAEVASVLEKDPTVQLVLADADLPPSGSLDLLENVRAQGKERPIWIVSGPADRRAYLASRLAAQRHAAYHDSGGPPENLIYAVNTLSSAPAVSQRTSARLLHGVPSSFRVEGRTNVVWGATFNVSRGGVYLRTLTPPAFGAILRVRLEAPAGGRVVDLRAQVVWRKEFGARSGAPGPAGMGLQLAGCDPAELAEYEAGYDRLVAKTKE